MRYNAKRTGKYRSGLEATVRKSMPKIKGVRVEYEKDFINYLVPATYSPDFSVRLPSGKVIFLEVKGYFRPEDKKKMAAVKKCNPDLDIRFVFGSKNKKNERWCMKYGYPYSIGTVPKEWFLE